MGRTGEHALRLLRPYGKATFSVDSRQVALATWNVGEVWDVEALGA